MYLPYESPRKNREPNRRRGVRALVTAGTQQHTGAARKRGTVMRKLSTIIALLLFAGVATAQPAKKGGGDQGGGGKVKVYDFTGDTIEGDLIKPEGLDVNARDFAKHS